jgi:hypothetical protein
MCGSDVFTSLALITNWIYCHVPRSLDNHWAHEILINERTLLEVEVKVILHFKTEKYIIFVDSISN